MTVEEFASASICSVDPMNMSTAYWPASWHSTRFDRSDPSCAGEEHVRAGGDVALHAHFAAEAVHRLHPAALDGRDQRRMRVERPVPADLPAQAQLLAVGRQDEFDRRGVEADPVIERRHPVPLVDPAHRHHRHQDLHLADLARDRG